MNYDEIKQEDLVSDNIEETTKLANTLLKSMEEFITNSHTQSPLAQFYNLAVLMLQMDDMTQQTHNAALDYLRANETAISAIAHSTLEDEDKRLPWVEKDGVTYKLLQAANFRNLATKDQLLNSLIRSEKDTNIALNRIQSKITKRIGELRATAEFKKFKPTKVIEAINLNFKA